MRASKFLSDRRVARLRAGLAAAIATLFLSGLVRVVAEETGKVFRVAILGPASAVPRYSAINRQAIRDLGYVEGQNLILIERWAGGSKQRLYRYAAELAG